MDGNDGATMISAGTLVVDAVTGVGSANALDTTVATLDIDNATSGNIDIAETDDVTVFKAAQATAGNIQVVAGGVLTVDNGGLGNAITAVGAGTVTLDANGANSDVLVNDGIQTVNGNVILTADDSVIFEADGDITTTSGPVSISANVVNGAGNNGNVITMVDGTVINAGDDTILLQSTGALSGDIRIGSLRTTNASDTSVTLTSTAGGIVDNGNTHVDVVSGGRLVIDAATGVGHTDALETTVASLDIDNATSGNIEILESDDVTIVRAVQATEDNIQVVTTNGDIVVSDGNNAADNTLISTLLTGTVTLTAQGANSDITLNDGISTATGSVILTADDSISLADNGGDITTTSGAVTLQADDDDTNSDSGDAITMVDGSVIDAGDALIVLDTNKGAGTNGGDITIGSLTTSNPTDAAITLDTDAGVVDGGESAVDVLAANGGVVIDAVTGVGHAGTIETTVTRLEVDNTLLGNIDIDNTAPGAVTVHSLTTGTGTITYDQTGVGGETLLLTNVAATDGSINISNTGGTGADITVGVITADTIDDVVTIDGTGEINDASLNPDTTIDITAAGIDIGAVEGIGDFAHLDLRGAIIDADTTSGNIDINNAATAGVTVNSLTTTAGTITFDQTGNRTLDVTTATTTDGAVTLTNEGATLRAFTVTAGGDTGSNDDITLTTTGGAGDVVVETSVTAANDQVDITAVDNITLNGTIDTAVANLTAGVAINGGGVLTAGTVDLNAVSGIGNTTALNIASATIDADTTSGNIDINNAATAAVTVNSLTTTTGTITFDQTGNRTLDVTTATTTDGAITLTNVGATLRAFTVTAGGDTGSNDDITLTTTGGAGDVVVETSVTAANDQVDITAVDNITLNGTIDTAVANLTAGAAINEGGVLTAGTVDLNAVTGIGNTTALNIASTTINADTTNGNIDINNAAPGAVTVNSMTTGTGAITYDQTGIAPLALNSVNTTDGAITINNNAAITATNVQTSGGADDDDISLTATSLIVGTVSASSSGDVNLTANTGGISDAAGKIAADVLTANSTGPMVLDTTVTTLNANNAAAGNINVTETTDIALSNITTANGDIIVTAGGSIDADIVNAGNTNNVTLNAQGGGITDLVPGPGKITANLLTADAVGPMDLDTTVASLDASTSVLGALSVSETNDINLIDVDTANGAITVTAGGNVTATDVASVTDTNLNDITITSTGAGIEAGSINAGTLGDVSLSAQAAITDDPSGRVTADSLVATANGAMTISTDVNTITATTTAPGLMTLIDYGSVELSNVQTNSGGIQAFVSANLTASIVQAGGGGDVRLNASNMTLGDVDAGNTVYLATGDTINGGIFSGSNAELNASTAGLSSRPTIDVPNIIMTLTGDVSGKSGEFIAGGALINRPPDANIVSAGTVTIDPFTPYVASFVNVDISAILSSLATQSSAAQQLEALLDATTASEFFMSPPLEIYIDMAEQSEFEDTVEDSLESDF